MDGSTDVSQSLQRLIPQTVATPQQGRPAAGKMPSWGSIVDNELSGAGKYFLLLKILAINYSSIIVILPGKNQ